MTLSQRLTGLFVEIAEMLRKCARLSYGNNTLKSGTSLCSYINLHQRSPLAEF